MVFVMKCLWFQQLSNDRQTWYHNNESMIIHVRLTEVMDG